MKLILIYLTKTPPTMMLSFTFQCQMAEINNPFVVLTPKNITVHIGRIQAIFVKSESVMGA